MRTLPPCGPLSHHSPLPSCGQLPPKTRQKPFAARARPVPLLPPLTASLLTSLLIPLLALSLLLSPLTPALAATVTTNLDDDGTATGTLRKAITEANTSETITFAITPSDATTITLVGPLPTFSFDQNDLTIDGLHGSDRITLDGGEQHQMFLLGSAASQLTLKNMVLRNGMSATSGGAINADNLMLTLDGTTFNANAATASGGAIYSDGILMLNTGAVSPGDSAFTGNSVSTTAADSGYGGAVYAAGAISIMPGAGSIIFNNNSATSTTSATSGYGGAVYSTGALTLTPAGTGGVSFVENTASGHGGAVYAKDSLTINTMGAGNISFTRNSAASTAEDSGYGGAIYATGDLMVGTIGAGTIAFSHNSASGHGGAVYAVGTVTNRITVGPGKITFSNNSASGDGGAVYSASPLEIMAAAADMTFSNNSALKNGGAVYASGALTVRTGNTNGILFSGNSAGSGGGAIHAGGGISLSSYGLGNVGDIHFTGNKVGSETSGYTSNAIQMSGGLLNIEGTGNVIFGDPIAPASEASINTFISSAALVQFAGDSLLSGNADGGGTTVSGGFRVLSGATFDTGGTSSSAFFTQTGGTLSGAGTIASPGLITLGGTISPGRQAYTPASDLSVAGTLSGENTIGTLSFRGNVVFSGATIEVDLAASDASDTVSVTGDVDFTGGGNNTVQVAAFRKGEYTIIGWTGAESGDENNFNPVMITGAPLNSRQSADLSIDSKKLLLTMAAPVKSLTWLGTTDEWADSKESVPNWQDENNAGIFFLNDDTVTFDSTATTKAVAVDADGVTVAGMTVSDEGYSFSGGKISGATLLLDATVPSTVTFSNEIGFKDGITVNADNILKFNYSASATVADVISGDGGLATAGAGALTLSGANTYTGKTSIGSGGLTVAGKLGGGDYGGTIENGGSLTLDQTADQTLSGPITGTGSLVKQGANTLTLSSTASDYSGTTTVSGGTVVFAASDSLGTGAITLNGGGLQWAANNSDDISDRLDPINTVGTVLDVGNNTVTFSTALTGTGALIKEGTGTLTLTGNNSLTGGFAVRAGTLQIGDIGIAGSLNDNVRAELNTRVAFWQTGNADYTGVISGQGGLTKALGGTLTLSGVNTYTGGTTISGGNLVVTGKLGDGDYAGEIVASGTLTLNQSTPQILRGDITDPASIGAVEKQGAQTLTVTGSIAPDFSLSGGTLAGTGTLNKVTLTSGTKVSPGMTAGETATLSMGKTGATTAFNGVTYVLDTAPGNVSDRIAVTGTVDLAGGKIDIASWKNGKHAIMTTTALFLNNIRSDAITVNGSALTGRQSAALSFEPSNLILTLKAVSIALTWTGQGGSTWNQNVETNTVWKDAADNPGYFINHDTVAFSADAVSANRAVTVAASGVTVDSMTVSADGYSFSEGKISGNTLSLAAGAYTTTFKNDISFVRAAVNAGHTLVFDYDADTDLSNSTIFSGAGNLSKQGGGSLVIMTDTSRLTGSVNVTAGFLGLRTSDSRVFANPLTGAGTLGFDLGKTQNALSFTSDVGGAFTGTLYLTRGSLDIDENAATVLSGATLHLEKTAAASLSAERTIGNLAFNGGSLSITGNGRLITGELSVSAKGGSVSVDESALNSLSITPGDRSFFDHVGEGSTLYQKQIITATSVTGAGSLILNDVSDKAETHDILNGKDTVGKATYNYAASLLGMNRNLVRTAAFSARSAPQTDKGLYLGYGLTQIEALKGKTVPLDSSTSTVANPTLVARLTGAGGFSFTGDKAVAVGNSGSDYTGPTLIKTVAVSMTTDNALGKTSGLSLQNKAGLNMNGLSQTVGNLSGDKDSTINLGSLTVNQTTGTTYAGTLTDSAGKGTLTKTGAAPLTLSGKNTYTGGTRLELGSLILTDSTATGTGPVTTSVNSQLGLSFSGAYANSISGKGALAANPGANKTLTLSGKNTYSGPTTVTTGTLSLGSDLASSKDLTLYGGTTFDTGGHKHSVKGGTLTVWQGGATYKGDLSAENADMSFIATDKLVSPMLQVTGAANIDNSRIYIGAAGDTKITSGDNFSLLQAARGVSGTARKGEDKSFILVGATIKHDIDFTYSPEGIVVGTVSKGRATNSAKALSEGHLGAMALTIQGADLAAGQGMDAALRATRAGNGASGNPAGTWNIAGFGAVSGGTMRYNTGSHVDMDSISLLTGLALGVDLAPGHLTLGAFFEFGNGSYDTHNSFSNAASVKGDGSTYYLGGGLLGRMDFLDLGPGHAYLEASGRIGKVHNDYDSSDLRDSSGRKTDYDTSSLYHSLHFGAGYIWDITGQASLDVYAKYFWTHQEGESTNLSSKERLRFKDANSHRTRTGARFAYIVNDHVRPYIGAAWEYEFDAKAKATTNGNPIDPPDLKGSTGIGEIGLTIKPSASLPLSFDLGAQGYVGKREGVTGSLQIRWEF